MAPQKKTNKSTKNSSRRSHDSGASRELILKDGTEEQEYAEILRPFGCNRFALRCFDGIDRQGMVRGRMNKKCFVRTGDIVLVSVRPFEDKTADIIHKFTDDEVRRLRSLRELPESAGGARADDHEAADEDVILFGEEDETSLEANL
eukprot:m.473687 g.473687  ORF g.473687 m.473687 type:complete len:147 (-) comp34856_c0_seq1:57-497(-)